MDLLSFPEDVLFNILQKIVIVRDYPFDNYNFLKKKRFKKSDLKIDPRVLGRLCLVSKDFNNEFSSDYFWLKLLTRDYKNDQQYKRIPKNPRLIYHEKIIFPFYLKEYDKNKILLEKEKINIKIYEKDKQEIMKCIREALLSDNYNPIIKYTDPYGQLRLLNGFGAFSLKYKIFRNYDKSLKLFDIYSDKDYFYKCILGIDDIQDSNTINGL